MPTSEARLLFATENNWALLSPNNHCVSLIFTNSMSAIAQALQKQDSAAHLNALLSNSNRWLLCSFSLSRSLSTANQSWVMAHPRVNYCRVSASEVVFLAMLVIAASKPAVWFPLCFARQAGPDILVYPRWFWLTDLVTSPVYDDQPITEHEQCQLCKIKQRSSPVLRAEKSVGLHASQGGDKTALL